MNYGYNSVVKTSFMILCENPLQQWPVWKMLQGQTVLHVARKCTCCDIPGRHSICLRMRVRGPQALHARAHRGHNEKVGRGSCRMANVSWHYHPFSCLKFTRSVLLDCWNQFVFICQTVDLSCTHSGLQEMLTLNNGVKMQAFGLGWAIWTSDLP